MTDISHDFSLKPDLLPMAEVVKSLQSVAVPMRVEFFLIGAAARDLLLGHAYGIHGRRTEDVDFCVMVSNWEEFKSLREALIASGEFSLRPGAATHRLRHRNGRPLDIVPFGSIERPDRTIAWPPDHSTVFDCFGAREAFEVSIQVRLPSEVVVQVASIPSLAILKVTAWNDRKHTQPGKDAPDLVLLLRNYLDCGNFGRATGNHQRLVRRPGL